MGLPTEGGPDLIFNRGRDDVTIPWRRLLVGAVLGLWVLFVGIPYLVAEDPPRGMLVRGTTVAAVALLLIVTLPRLVASQRRAAAAGAVLLAVAALAWVLTA